jgi:hypothetical protein
VPLLIFKHKKHIFLKWLVVFLIINISAPSISFNSSAAKVIESNPLVAESMPRELTEIKNASYSYRQTMMHWKDGLFSSSGNVTLFLSNPSSSAIRIQADYYLNVWQQSCNKPNQLQGTITTISDIENRNITATPTKIGNLDLTGKFNHWFLGKTLVGNYPRFIMVEEMMYLHGIDGISESPQYTPVFDYQGNEIKTILGQSVETNKISWTGQRFYAGTICGLGTGPLINITLNYYYHSTSGILLLAETEIIEYMNADPGIYQKFTFNRTLRGINDDGSGLASESTTTSKQSWIPTDPRERDIFITILASGGIILLGIVAMVIIHHQGMKWKVKALLEYEELQKKQNEPQNQD